jgi:hypothetical protein
MGDFFISCSQTTLKVKCNKTFCITVELGGVHAETTATVCFKLESPSCFFLPGADKQVCRDPLPLSPGVIKEKRYCLTIQCTPAGDGYGTDMDIIAKTAEGETDEATIILDIDCY